MKRAAGTTLALPKGTAYDSWAQQVVPDGEPSKGKGNGLPAFPPSVNNKDAAAWSRVVLASEVEGVRMAVMKGELEGLVAEESDRFYEFCIDEITVWNCG